MVRGLRWTGGIQLLTQLMTWSVTIVVMRLLEPEDYGIVALTGIFVMYAGVISEFGLPMALVQGRVTDERALRSALGISLSLSVLCCLVLIVASGRIASFFDQPKLAAMVQFAAIQFPIAAVGTIAQAQLSQALRFRELSLAALLASIAQSLSTLVLAWLYPGPWALLIGMFCGTVARVIALNVYQPLRFWPSLALAPLRPILRVALYIFASRSLWYWYGQVDRLVIGKRLGARDLGAYSSAKLFVSLPLDKVMEVINRVSFPAFSSINHDADLVSDRYEKAVRITAMYAFPAFWGLAAVAPVGIDVLLGEKWHVAAWPAAVLSLALPFRMLSAVGSPLLIAMGRSDLSLLVMIQTFVLVAVALYIGSFWGLNGVSVAWAVAMPIASVYAVGLTLKLVRIDWKRYFAQVRGAAIAAAMMVVVVEFGVEPLVYGMPGIARLALEVLAGIAVYWGAISLLDPAGRDETISLVLRVLGRSPRKGDTLTFPT